MNNDFSFPKRQRLKSRKKISQIFEKGQSLWRFPIKLVWLEFDDSIPTGIQAAFVAPKRKFKKAVDRNLIKRRMREAYRLNKSKDFLFEHSIGMMFLYLAPDVLPYSDIEKSMKQLLKKLHSQIFPEK